MMKLTEVKIRLYEKCCNIVENRIKQLEETLQEVQNAANNETKSSVGDKHETGRAMAQLETEKLSSQLSESISLRKVIQQINPKQNYKLAGLGSLVITSNGMFFIAVSLGKIEIENETFFAISTASPVGKLLLTKKEKDSFSFNGKKYVIKQII